MKEDSVQRVSIRAFIRENQKLETQEKLDNSVARRIRGQLGKRVNGDEWTDIRSSARERLTQEGSST